jgi:hypothetical protein
VLAGAARHLLPSPAATVRDQQAPQVNLPLVLHSGTVVAVHSAEQVSNSQVHPWQVLMQVGFAMQVGSSRVPPQQPLAASVGQSVSVAQCSVMCANTVRRSEPMVLVSNESTSSASNWSFIFFIGGFSTKGEMPLAHDPGENEKPRRLFRAGALVGHAAKRRTTSIAPRLYTVMHTSLPCGSITIQSRCRFSMMIMTQTKARLVRVSVLRCSPADG